MIRVKGLSKKFDHRGIAGVHDLTLEIQKGEIFSIMGPNGSGKTTLLRMLAGVLTPDAGTVTIEGAVKFFSTADYVSESNVQRLLIQSVQLDVDDEKKLQLTRDLADTFEFTFQLRQRFCDLSTGQKQRVLLAKELINSPSLLLLDEPFAHLDPFMRKEILKALFRYIRQKEMTVAWVTHDLEEALKFSDRIGLMNFGRVEQVGHPLSFIQTPRNLFVAQFMGYENFIPITYSENRWTSPWGEIPLPPLENPDALLVVNDRGWKLNEGLPFKVQEAYPGSQCVKYVLTDETRKIVMKRSPGEELLKTGATVLIAPDLKESFIIRL